MRHELTWEVQVSGRSMAAAVYERGVMALALALPVPLLAAAGLSLPLPDGVYRLGAAAVQRTASIANALPSLDRGSGEPEQTTVAAKPAVGPTVHRSKARAAIVFSVVAHQAARSGHKPSAAARASAKARAMRRAAVSHSEFAARGTPGSATGHVPTGDEAGTQSNAVTTPEPTHGAATPAAASAATAANASSSAPASSASNPPATTPPSTTVPPSTTAPPSAKESKAAQEAADRAAKAAAEQAARDAKAAQEAADQAAKAAAEQATKAQEAADRAAKAAADQARKDAQAAAEAAKKAGSGSSSGSGTSSGSGSTHTTTAPSSN